jgi:hypothetical protein
MIAVIFEVLPYPGERHTYLDLAGQLRPELERSMASCRSNVSKV